MPTYDVYLKDPKRSPFDPWGKFYRPVFRGIEATSKERVKELWEDYRLNPQGEEFKHMTIDEIKIANKALDADLA